MTYDTSSGKTPRKVRCLHLSRQRRGARQRPLRKRHQPPCRTSVSLMRVGGTRPTKTHTPGVYDPAWGRAERAVKDTLQPMSTKTWFIDGALEGWKGVAAWPDPSHAAPNLYDPPVSGVGGTWPQTWPVRYCDYHVDFRRAVNSYVLKDWTLFCYRVSNPDFRNLYIGSHMTAQVGHLVNRNKTVWK